MEWYLSMEKMLQGQHPRRNAEDDTCRISSASCNSLTFLHYSYELTQSTVISSRKKLKYYKYFLKKNMFFNLVSSTFFFFYTSQQKDGCNNNETGGTSCGTVL